MRNSSSIQRVIQTCLLAVLSLAVHAEDLPPLMHVLTPVTGNILAPSLSLKNMDGDSVNTKDMLGTILIVNFWASWCPPCRREMGSLERLYQATKDNNVEVIAVNIGEDEDMVFAFMGQIDIPISFQILLDQEGGSMDSWNVRGLPTTYIVDRQGMIIYRAVGGREFDHADIIALVKKL